MTELERIEAKLDKLLQRAVVSNGEISISKQEWSKMNSCLDKDTIKQLISDAIGAGLELPYRRITHEDAKCDFNKLLELDTRQITKDTEWFTRYEYENIDKKKVIGTCNIGNKSSDLFQQEARWLCDSINAPSPYRTWGNEKFRMTLLNALWSLNMKQVNSTTLRSCIGLRKYIASQFRPSAAKCIYEMFGSEKILDTSSGWGDRFCGFASTSAVSYTGIDPNENVHDGYLKQKRFYENILGKELNATFIKGCSEDEAMYPTGKFDTMFTSPPYFNVERYTQDENQSFKKHKKLDDWLNNFLFKTIKNTWGCLEDQGSLIVNISDVYSNHTINAICDKMVDFSKTLHGCNYEGTLGYEMRKRPNSGALKGKQGLFCEPMWVFKKHNRIY